MLHVRRYFAALLVLSLLCGTYALAVSPWIAPPPVVRRESAEAPPPGGASDETMQELARLFPSDAWERKNPKIFETEKCTLLIQDYLPLPDGRLEMKPCTLIFHADWSDGGEAGGVEATTRRRPIVLRAPKAELLFDRPLDLAKAEFGRLEKGTLTGEIVIFSPPSTSTARDELLITTRSIWIDRERIATNSNVEFRYGNSAGRGSNLEITLAASPKSEKTKKSALGAVHTLKLGRLEHLRIETEGTPLWSGAPNAGRNGQSAAPLEITCLGPFVFDLATQTASFEDRVEVRRILPAGQPDRLLCDELLLGFRLKSDGQAAAASDAGKSGNPSEGKLQRIVAIGNPAVLQAPTSGIEASGACLEYSLVEQRMTLRSDDAAKPARKVTQVMLRQDQQQCVAQELHYALPDSGRIGRLFAKGPGELRLIQGASSQQQTIVARWEKELKIQPQSPFHVISLLQAASVSSESMGRLDGNELHLWVAEEESPPVEGGGNGPRMGVVPHRLRAVGEVRLVSPQLDADTACLEVWLAHRPPAASPMPPRENPGGIIREPGEADQPTRAQGLQSIMRNGPDAKALQKFHVGGPKIQLQFLVAGDRFDLEDLNIDGQVVIDETRVAVPGQEPIRVRGNILALRKGTTPDARIQISGQPAEVGGRGMWLAGNRIDVERGENRLTIDGAGEATLPAVMPGIGLAPGVAAPPPAGPQTMHVVWQQGLLFDGLTARCQGEVQVRTATQIAHTPVLEVILDQRLDFQARAAQPQPQLARVFLDGGAVGVKLENRGVDELGEQNSYDQMWARNLSIDRLTGLLHADGPGWVSSVRRGGSQIPGSNSEELSSIHVAFERGIDGNLASREIRFQQQVQTTYSPARDFYEIIAADPLRELGERMALMQSDVLTVTEMIHPPRRWFEMMATGHTKVQGQKFHIDAPIVRYSTDKEVLVLEGDGRATAKGWYQPVPGQPPDQYDGQKLLYYLRTGKFESDMIKSIRIPLSPDMKLPGIPAIGTGKKEPPSPRPRPRRP